MKVTVQKKNGLNKDLKVFVDKKTINSHLEDKYDELKKTVALKGFRPGKVPKEILKKQFGQAIIGEVIDKVLKETSTKAIEDNKIRPAGQPKIDLKSFGEDKDLEYIISVTEIPTVDLKSLENIKFDDYTIKLDAKDTEERIEKIAKSQKNFVDVDPAKVANDGDLVVFDYKATVDGNNFKGNEGKNTQLEIGKDLFIKGFDKQLLKVKKDETVNVEVILPENFPDKEFAGKKAIFVCKITAVKKPEKVKINDDFAKSLGAKDLNNLKELISKQINDEYKNSLDNISKIQILKQIEKHKLEEIPENLLEQEFKILSHGMKEDEVKKNKNKLEEQAKKRIKTGIILNEFGEKNNIKVTEQEIQAEIQKQLRMMPGQENIVKEYYEKNPEALASMRGSIYEEKIIQEIKNKSKANKKQISKHEAEEILKKEHEHSHSHLDKDEDHEKKSSPTKTVSKKLKSTAKKAKKTKKVSKK